MSQTLQILTFFNEHVLKDKKRNSLNQRNEVLLSIWQFHYQELMFLKKLYGPFLWTGFNCLTARATLRRQCTFYHKFSEIPGTHFIDLQRMKGWVNLGLNEIN